jgi:GNAT superfamily N-acetyltransferase
VSSRYGLQIRTPDTGDAPGLAELYFSAGVQIAATALAARLETMARCPGAVFIAQEWGPPSGLVALHWYPGLQADPLTARLTEILVAPEARRRGLGRLLLKAASRAARLAGCDMLECFPAACGPEAGAFLLAAGFIQTGSQFVRPLRKKS